VHNSLAVLAAAVLVGADLALAALALADFKPLRTRRADRDRSCPAARRAVIDESYNANPVRSMPRWRCSARRRSARAGGASPCSATCSNWAEGQNAASRPARAGARQTRSIWCSAVVR
jgi:hypothetical protein